MLHQQKQQHRMQAQGSADGWFQAKLCCLLALLLGDLLLNSSAEYDDFATLASSASSDSKPQLIAVMILGVQLLLQVAVLLSLFVMMFDTWPFKAGLMGLLVDQYKWVCAVSAAYMLATAVLYGYRLNMLFGAESASNGVSTAAWQTWDSSAYTAFSTMHKLGQSLYIFVCA
jgi:Transmembrane protein 138